MKTGGTTGGIPLMIEGKTKVAAARTCYATTVGGGEMKEGTETFN